MVTIPGGLSPGASFKWEVDGLPVKLRVPEGKKSGDKHEYGYRPRVE